MQLIEVFKESLKLMKHEPKVFVPRIFTTFLNTFFVIYAASISLKLSRVMNREMERAGGMGTTPDIGRAISPFMDEILVFAAFFLLVYAVDILTYGMYARIAADFHKRKSISLSRALKDAVTGARVLMFIGVLATIFVGLFIVIYLLLGRFYISTQNPLFLLLAIGVMIIAIIAFALVFFFAVPVAMVEGRSTKDAVLKSASLGMKHKGMVIKVNFLFMAMVLVAMAAVMLTEVHGFVAVSAIILFVIARLFQAIVYTYISIVNPSLYLSIEEVE
ncbi:hypothetical protein KKA03_05090 [archaeon]|nr:hypothetical protein [archaeon]